MTKFLDGAHHHALLGLLPMLWPTTRCRFGTAVAALILTVPVEARVEDDRGSAVIGWSIVFATSALSWSLAWWLASYRAGSTLAAKRPFTRSVASQTDYIEPPPVRVEVRHEPRPGVSNIYMTQRGEKFHVSEPCARHRSLQQVRTIECCLVCWPGPA